MLFLHLLMMPMAQGATEDLYRTVAPLVYQVKTAVDAEAPKASYGSGFVVSKDGLLATNYHVVSDGIHRAKTYKIYVVTKEASLEAKVVAIDVTHDLAIIKVPKAFESALEPRESSPEVGEKLFSLGIPKDLNMSIVDGLYNGLLKRTPYEQLQMSAPINPGMSGGPVVSGDGRVLGVNVAVMLDSQSITFGVPVRHLVALLETARAKPLESADPKEFYAEIEHQLVEAQKLVAAEWAAQATATTEFPGWKVRKPPDAMRCWLTKPNEEKEKKKKKIRYSLTGQTCRIPESIFLTTGARTGVYSLSYKSVSNERLSPVQFFAALDSVYNATLSMSIIESPIDTKKEETANECGEQTFVNSNDVPIKLNYCMSGYYKFGTILNARVKMMTMLKRQKHALVVYAHLDGFALPALLEFIKVTAESIRESVKEQ